MLVGGTGVIDATAEDVDGLLAAVGGPVGRGQQQRAATLAGHGAIKEVERVGHHAGGQHVLDGERSPAVVGRFGVDVAVVANGGGHRGQMLGQGPVHLHVAPGDQGELQRRVHAEGDDKLIGRSGPRCGRRPLGIDPGPAAGDQGGVTVASGDGVGRLQDHLDPSAHARARPHRSETQAVDELAGELPEYAIDLAGVEAGRVEHAAGRFGGDPE